MAGLHPVMSVKGGPFLLLLVLCQSSLQGENTKIAMSDKEGVAAVKDSCLHTYKAFQPNLSSIKEKVAKVSIIEWKRRKPDRYRMAHL